MPGDLVAVRSTWMVWVPLGTRCGELPGMSNPDPSSRKTVAKVTLVSPPLGAEVKAIGAGAETDGQVLVWHDMLGMYEGRTPRFVKRYAEIADEIGDAVARYAGDVRGGAFPEDKHTYGISEEELARFEETLRGS